MSQTPSFPGTPYDVGVKVQAADATNYKDFVPNVTGGVMIGSIRAANQDAVNARVLVFAKNIGGVDYVLGEVSVPAGAGTNGATPWVDVLALLNLGVAINVAATSKLRVKAKVAVTSDIELVAEGGQF